MVSKICVSIGDYNGIGSEVFLKACSKFTPGTPTAIIVVCSPKILSFYSGSMPVPGFSQIESPNEVDLPGFFILDPSPDMIPDIRPGKPDIEASRYAIKSLELATRYCLSGEANALVTAPIHKYAMQQAGFPFPGHTEFLAKACNSTSSLMVLVNDSFRVALATTHIPVSKISESIHKKGISDKTQKLHYSLKTDFGIESPKIAVLALNPHAGDNGMMGMEEIEVISPVIESLCGEGMQVEGPFPADGFFGSGNHKRFDGILAMYHDQGLAPFKALSFGKGVNVTAGLPIVRTSPDHGTAFDIAGKNSADGGSFLQSLQLATHIVKNRRLN